MKLLVKTLILGAAIAASGTAFADTISYTTTGTFGCGTVMGTCSTTATSITVTQGGNSATLTFAPGSGVVNSPTNINLGSITASSASMSSVNLAGLTMLLTVNQTMPAGSGSFGSGSVTGTIMQSSSGASLTFANPTAITINGELYTVFNPTPLVAPTTNGGVTTIQGNVSPTVTPEPSSLILLGTGLLGMAGVVRRRMARVS